MKWRPRCGFCGRKLDDVRYLIESPAPLRRRSFICDVCILLAVHALAERLASDQ